MHLPSVIGSASSYVRASRCARARVALVLAALLLAPAAASAFTFSDGSYGECATSEGVAREREHAADDPSAPRGFIGFTHHEPGSGWTIDWNLLLLSSAPDVEHDFVFFHECAHARTGTRDELEANCTGLVDMRAAGRAGRVVEAKLAAYHHRQGYLGEPYGIARDYWARTVACANRR
jgi:hypothetical protein